MFFKSPNLQRKILQITILNLKFKFLTITINNKFKFQAQDSHLEYFYFGDLKNPALAFAQIIPSLIKRFVILSLLRQNNMKFAGYSIQNKVNNIAEFAKRYIPSH